VPALALALACAAAAPSPAQQPAESATRAPAAPAAVPEPEVVSVMMGAWAAEIPDAGGGTLAWRLELRPDGRFTLNVSDGDQPETRTGTYEIDARSVRLIFPGAAEESSPNSTALSLSDARSLETYFYRLLGPDRLAFRPTLCSVDPCQWIAERAD
jgi:hypothetical protein